VADGPARSPFGVPGIRVLIVTVLVTSVAFGSVEVAVPAFAEAHGDPGAAGIVLALFAAGGMLGGPAFGARTWRGSPVRRFLVVSALAAGAEATLALPTSLVALAGALVEAAGTDAAFLAGAGAAAIGLAVATAGRDRLIPSE
jgi:hypothetical protein